MAAVLSSATNGSNVQVRVMTGEAPVKLYDGGQLLWQTRTGFCDDFLLLHPSLRWISPTYAMVWRRRRAPGALRGRNNKPPMVVVVVVVVVVRCSASESPEVKTKWSRSFRHVHWQSKSFLFFFGVCLRHPCTTMYSACLIDHEKKSQLNRRPFHPNYIIHFFCH